MITYINGLPVSDEVNSAYLEQMLSNFSASYKIFWFYGIYKEIINGNREFSFRRIFCRMISLAWYPTVYCKLNLGWQDKLYDHIKYVIDNLNISIDEDDEKIVNQLYYADDKGLNVRFGKLSENVPYRLIGPFYENKLKKADKVNGSSFNNCIAKLSNEDNNPFYRIDKSNRMIYMGDKWFDYIYMNQSIIEGWITNKLVMYLQARNPNVPGIPFKIKKPLKRDLSKATSYWRYVITNSKVNDIYSDVLFDDSNIKELSIDHFIPWSFVLNDELWNLVPTFKSVNSSKSDRLPDLSLYMDKFCSIQYLAFINMRCKNKMPKLLEEYYSIDRNFYFIDKPSEENKGRFEAILKQTIEPLYQMAANQGFAAGWNWSEIRSKEVVLK